MSVSDAPEAGELRHHDDVLVLLVRRNVLALAWYDAPRAGHLREVNRLVHEVQRTRGVPPCMINVVVRGTPRFPEEVRAEGATLVRETTPYAGTTAHVIEVEGLAGTATRMFLSTMLLVGRGRAPHTRVFAEHHAACAWLAGALTSPGGRPEHAWSAGALEALYRALKFVLPRG